MSALDSQSVLCPELIGRDAHLDVIRQLMDQTAAGNGRALLLSAEAGMGKSRLLEEIRRLAEACGWRTLVAYCTEFERDIAYAPVLPLLHAAGETEAAALIAATRAPNRGGGQSAPDRMRLGQAIVHALVDAAQSVPQLVIVEDLHWCDEATLDLLPYLARRLAGQPLLLVLTYRPDEVYPALTHCLAQFDRMRHVHELRLDPLSRAEVDAMLRAIFGQARPARAPFLNALYAFTEGNPFFIEESLKSMAMSGDLVIDAQGVWTAGALEDFHIPRTVRDAVEQRSERISPAAQEVLRLAAVAGRRFDFALLQRLTSLSEIELTALLTELLHAQFLHEESADRLSFRHALTRECIYGSILARERRRLHAAIADELASLYAGRLDDYVTDLAYHAYAGERWPEALAYARKAGENALALHALQSAAEQFSRALHAAQRLHDPALHLHLQRGTAYGLLGHFDAAQQDFLTALDAARRQGDLSAEWRATLYLGGLWVTRDAARGGVYLREALSLAERLGDPHLAAQSHNAVGNWEMNQGRPVAALNHHRKALAIFRAADDAAGIAATLDLLAIASYNLGDIVGGIRHYQGVLPLWRAHADLRGLLHTLSGLGLGADLDLQPNDTPLSQHVTWGEEGIAAAREMGWQSGLALALIASALVKRQAGCHGAALDELAEARRHAEEANHQSWLVDALISLGVVLADLFALDEARATLEQALSLAQDMDTAIWIANASMALAAVYSAQGDLARATQVVDAALAAYNGSDHLQSRGLWFAKAELALAGGQAQEALAICTRLSTAPRGVPPENWPHGLSSSAIPRFGLLHAQTLSALDHKEAAATLLDAAILHAQAQERTHTLWRLHAARARLAAERHDPAAVETSVDAARQIVHSIEADLRAATSIDAGALADRFVGCALASLPARECGARNNGSKSSAGVLTPREEEVVALVAQGLSNRVIAETLVLSERTAERHIANIMNKLGHSSRTQIAAWYLTSHPPADQ